MTTFLIDIAVVAVLAGVLRFLAERRRERRPWTRGALSWPPGTVMLVSARGERLRAVSRFVFADPTPFEYERTCRRGAVRP